MSITLFGVLAAAGFLIAGYLLWRQAGDERLDQKEVFNLFLGSAGWALVVARATAIILNFDHFGWNLWRWLSFFYLPGLSGPAALVIGILMIIFGASRRRWDKWLTLDVFVPALMMWQAFLLVYFYWYVGLFWFLWSIFLMIVSTKYRLWGWYRGKSEAVNPGLTFCFWLVGTGIGLLVFSLVFKIAGIIGIGCGIAASYIRSSRILRSDIQSIRLFFKRKKKYDISQ